MSKTSAVRSIVALLRPKQWAKNSLVFAAPGALGILDEGDVLATACVLFVGFCLVASGLYAWNDVRDRESDAAHPSKRNRPVASGAVSASLAARLGTVLIILGLATATLADPAAGAVTAVYAAVTTAYSLGLKSIPVVEMMVVASGFVLRAVAGAVALDVDMSEWFLLCTMFGSLFVVAGKRFAEMLELGDSAQSVRSTMRSYTLDYLRVMYVLACGTTMIAYCLWAFQSAASATDAPPLYELSILPIVAVLARYVHLLETGHGGAPEEIFFRDRMVQLWVVVWAVTYGSAVYFV